MSQTPRLSADRLYGGVALVLLALAAFFALRGGPRDGAATAAVPVIVVQPPAEAQPLTLVFEPGVEMRPGPAGWTSEGRHLHARIGVDELMAGTADIQPLGGGRYRWVLPRLPRGEHAVQLFWSDEAHRPLRAGASVPVRVYLE